MLASVDSEIDHIRILGRKERHYAVIDIGSNSIRLVVYDDLNRAPFQRFNEKSLCALGASFTRDDCISQEGMDCASHAVKRFVAIARAMNVGQIDVLATEAVRRARNQEEFAARIDQATGLKMRVLSGAEEATYAALGVIAGFHQPKGLVGDMGGGSLDFAEILGDRVGERRGSIPLGAFPVLEMMAEGVDPAKKRIDKILRERMPPLLTAPVLYAVGGGWRALGRIFIASHREPISVVHGLEVPNPEARALAKRVARMLPDEVALLPDVPSRRVETLPAAALVMSRILRHLRPEKVVFSVRGLREGWLYSQLCKAEQQRDPLLEGAQSIGLPRARVPEFSAALAAWTDTLFSGETPAERRIRMTACILSDMAWRDHTKVRAMESFHRLLQFPFLGITHAERAFLAVAIMARYGGKVNQVVEATVGHLLSESGLLRAEILGRVLLVGHRFSGSVPEILEQGRLRIEADAVRLEVRSTDCVPDSDAVHARLRQLAKVCGVDGAEVINVGQS